MQTICPTFYDNVPEVIHLASDDVGAECSVPGADVVQERTGKQNLTQPFVQHPKNLQRGLLELAGQTTRPPEVPSAAIKLEQSKARTGSPSPDRTTVLKRNNVRVLGDGPETIVFAHGFGCNQEMWRSVASAFLSNYKVVLFDHIGAGAANSASFDRIRHSSLQGYTQDVLDILEVLDLQRVHFVGHSVSGMIGALASIADPELFAS